MHHERFFANLRTSVHTIIILLQKCYIKSLFFSQYSLQIFAGSTFNTYTTIINLVVPVETLASKLFVIVFVFVISLAEVCMSRLPTAIRNKGIIVDRCVSLFLI